MADIVQKVDTAESLQDLDTLAQPKQSVRRGWTVVVVAILGVLVVMGVIFAIGLSRQNQAQPQVGPAPDFTLTTLEGQEIALKTLRGRVVVVNFWASWCAPCREEAADLQKTYEQYKDKDVIFLGIAYTDTERGARDYIKQYGITYPNGLDLKTKISDAYRIQGVPETFIIDRDGNIADFVMFQLTSGQLGQRLDSVLAKQ